MHIRPADPAVGHGHHVACDMHIGGLEGLANLLTGGVDLLVN